MAPDKLPFDREDTKPRPCPICGKPSLEAMAPFCSKRCSDIDLHKWLGGVYAVPADEPGQSDGEDD